MGSTAQGLELLWSRIADRHLFEVGLYGVDGQEIAAKRYRRQPVSFWAEVRATERSKLLRGEPLTFTAGPGWPEVHGWQLISDEATVWWEAFPEPWPMRAGDVLEVIPQFELEGSADE